MIDAIVNQLVNTGLSSLAVFSRKGGIVRPQKANVNGKVKIFPVALRLDGGECQPGDYLDFVPNSKESGILYFEQISNSKTNDTPGGQIFTAQLRVVGWVNLRRISPPDISVIAANVVKAIAERQPDMDYLKNIKFTFEGFEPKSPDVFSKYTYQEEESQFMMYPYDWFSGILKVRYLFLPSCVPSAETVENDC